MTPESACLHFEHVLQQELGAVFGDVRDLLRIRHHRRRADRSDHFATVVLDGQFHRHGALWRIEARSSAEECRGISDGEGRLRSASSCKQDHENRPPASQSRGCIALIRILPLRLVDVTDLQMVERLTPGVNSKLTSRRHSWRRKPALEFWRTCWTAAALKQRGPVVRLKPEHHRDEYESSG
jgi:hypothetical protein